jgi:hypothetical protein
VNANGTLDETNSKNVVVTKPIFDPTGAAFPSILGLYCFGLDFTPRSAIATLDHTAGPGTIEQDNIPLTILPRLGDFSDGVTYDCPDGFKSAFAQINNGMSNPPERSFFIIFN